MTTRCTTTSCSSINATATTVVSLVEAPTGTVLLFDWCLAFDFGVALLATVGASDAAVVSRLRTIAGCVTDYDELALGTMQGRGGRRLTFIAVAALDGGRITGSSRLITVCCLMTFLIA